MLPPDRTLAQIEFDFYASSKKPNLDEFRYFPILQEKFKHLLSNSNKKQLAYENYLLKTYDEETKENPVLTKQEEITLSKPDYDYQADFFSLEQKKIAEQNDLRTTNLIRAKEEAEARLEALQILEHEATNQDNPVQLNDLKAAKHLPLTPEQLAAANLILDFTDTRTLATKLKTLQITPAEFQTWNKDPVFLEYMRIRSEQLLANSNHLATAALLRLMERNDFKAIKYYFEISGRYVQNNTSQNGMNTEILNQVLFRVLEVIQRHVRDPIALKAVAKDLGILSKEINQPRELTFQ